MTELTPVIKIIDLIPAGALTALNGASILRKFYYFHSLPQHPAILTLTPRKVAHEEGKWKEKCENNSKIILKFSTHCYTETTKMKFVYFVENLTAKGSYRYGTTVSTVLNGFSRTAVSQRVQSILSVSFLHKIKSIMRESFGKCYRTARPNTSGNVVFCFTFLLIFLISLVHTSFCSLINVTRYWYKLILIPR